MTTSHFSEKEIKEFDWIKVVITDMDDTLVPCQIPLAKLASQHFTSPIKEKFLDKKRLLLHDTPNIYEAVGLKWDDMSKHVFTETFSKNHNFYKNTKFLRPFDLLKKLLKQSIVTKVGVITTTPLEKGIINSKQDFFVTHFTKEERKKINIHLVESCSLKKQKILDEYPDWQLFMEDRLHNVLDVINMTKKSLDTKINRIIIIPSYGWNLMDERKAEEFANHARSANITIAYTEGAETQLND